MVDNNPSEFPSYLQEQMNELDIKLTRLATDSEAQRLDRQQATRDSLRNIKYLNEMLEGERLFHERYEHLRYIG